MTWVEILPKNTMKRSATREYNCLTLIVNLFRDELSRHKLGLIEEEEKKAKEGLEERGEDGEKKLNGTLDPEVHSE